MAWRYLWALVACMPAASGAVNKCVNADGQISYQQQPCEGRGEVLVLPPAAAPVPDAALPSYKPAAAPAPAPTPAAPAATGAVSPASTAASETLPAAPAMPPTPFDREAGQCLSFYRSLMIDPAGAYFSDPSMSGEVLTMTVYMRGFYGGYTPMKAACEFRNFMLDESWSRIHARRHGWTLDLVRPGK